MMRSMAKYHGNLPNVYTLYVFGMIAVFVVIEPVVSVEPEVLVEAIATH